jgi:FdhD protein
VSTKPQESAVRDVEVLRATRAASTRGGDSVAREEPLEIRLGGAPLLVVMRTPGADRDLTAGLLFAERLVRAADDIGLIRHCTRAELSDSDADPGNVINVWLQGDAAGRAGAALTRRRSVLSGSSCGVCGRQSIDDLLLDIERLGSTLQVTSDVVCALTVRLREAQPAFDATGGLHAAGLFTPGGDFVGVAEDVGRHNAVDKVVGRQLLAGLVPLSEHVLVVSGRTSFEIVQKAAVAGVAVVASVSAPSSLAVDLAQAAGITLIGFVRGDAFNVYTHPHRVRIPKS